MTDLDGSGLSREGWFGVLSRTFVMAVGGPSEMMGSTNLRSRRIVAWIAHQRWDSDDVLKALEDQHSQTRYSTHGCSRPEPSFKDQAVNGSDFAARITDSTMMSSS